MPKKIVILGAGYAGIEAALTLQKKKKPQDDIEIILIDKNPYHTLLTELHEVAGNRISEDGIIVPLRDIFKYTDVKLIQDNIADIDFEKNKLKSDSNEYNYDYLLLAAGSNPNYYGIPGLEENCFPLWSYKDAVNIREHIKNTFILASQEKDPEKKKAMLTFVVGGGGFTGIELLGELAHWFKDLCTEYSIKKEEVKLVLIEALPNILSNLPDKAVKKAHNYLTQKLKVEVITGKAVTKVTPDWVEVGGEKTIPTKTIIWTAGVRACNLTDKLNIEKGKSCRIKVNEYTQTQYENVYSAGDISIFQTPEGSLPALVESALQTGRAAVLNILADIRGKEKKKLEPKLHGVMVSIGSYFAVSEIMGRQFSRLISIILKYMVNVHYLFGIGGFELVMRYLKDEFLYKKQNKTIVEKHISVLTPAFWLVPLRLFLGYFWLKEGLVKITDGWLVKAMLSGMPADAQTGASVTETGEKIFQIIYDYTPSWYAWIAETFVIPNALFFQYLIVLSELAIGIAFVSGTFTFLAALAALALNVNFLLSTGLYETSWWLIPAEIAMLGGAGRAFGVDHYLIPYLMRQWRYFVRNKKIKLNLFR
ncbi:MAG TPA: NAD(P)/FAD-dependent oxidoreductase [Clostridiaceae bacterium]|nr:NAD(P)/FAD-dependent oxidoreductase [Clostridiaceae bacterium]